MPFVVSNMKDDQLEESNLTGPVMLRAYGVCALVLETNHRTPYLLCWTIQPVTCLQALLFHLCLTPTDLFDNPLQVEPFPPNSCKRILSTFLPSSCCVELSGTVESRSTHVEHEVMYSRAELITEQAPPLDQQEPISAAGAGQESSLLSPSSEGGLSYHDEPSPVPEPTLPEGFKADELVWDGSESIDDELKTEEHMYKDVCDATERVVREEEIRFFPPSDEQGGPALDVSSETDGAYATAEQSMDDVDTGIVEREAPKPEDFDMEDEAKKADFDDAKDDHVTPQELVEDDNQEPPTSSVEETSGRPMEPVSADSADGPSALVGEEIALDRREEMLDVTERVALTHDQIKTQGDKGDTSAPAAESLGFPDAGVQELAPSDAAEEGEMMADPEEGTCRPLLNSSASCSSLINACV